MVDDPKDPNPPPPPARSLISGLLYLGQFVDHDLSLDRTPLARAGDVKPEDRINYRSPTLDLDSMYGGGPNVSPCLYYLPVKRASGPPVSPGQERFLIGTTSPSQQRRDLPRTVAGRPVIADSRNEENLILAQLHVLMLQFHNSVIAALEDGEIDAVGLGGTLFAKAQRLVTWHYQYIVLHEFLDQLLDRNIFSYALAQSGPLSGVPIEFALAGFRVGHSMIRNNYKINDSHESVPLEQLLNLNSMGSPPLGVLPDDWIIDWGRFFDGFPLLPVQKNRSHGLDPRIAKALHKLNFGTPLDIANSVQLYSLPAITLVRGARSGLPSGQGVAKQLPPEFNQQPLTDEEMAFEQTPETLALLQRCGFMNDTPLWFYVLQEAASKTKKQGLGPVGSWLIASTIIGLLKADNDSILKAGLGWEPPIWKSRGTAVKTMGDVVKVAFGWP
ncbi:MAG TPA: peroxidase family protein [Pyrinomonadaceae bacterium]|nr:peroxidase family protein [Pyrinomonadaceae bacterium]